MTGDDHGNNGTAGRFDIYTSDSPAGCSVADWECVRCNVVHVPEHSDQSGSGRRLRVDRVSRSACTCSTNCADFTPTSLEGNYVR